MRIILIIYSLCILIMIATMLMGFYKKEEHRRFVYRRELVALFNITDKDL